MKKSGYIDLLKQAFAAWSADKAPRLAAALSYYTVFSLAPLLLIIISVASLVFGTTSAKQQIIFQMEGVMGRQSTSFITTILSEQNNKTTSGISSVIGVITLLLGASGLFSHLKNSFNDIWHIQPKKKGILRAVIDNLLSFSMVIAISFLLLVTLIISTVISIISTYFQHIIPYPSFILQIINTVISMGVVTLLFASMYKTLPDTKVFWRDVWVGALFTAALFTAGKAGLSWYFAHSAGISKYGAAGSLILVLLWVYYSSQILFFGAEFTKVYSLSRDSKAVHNRKQVEHKRKVEVVATFLEGFLLGLFKKRPKP